MPGVDLRGAGEEVLGTLASLNKKAKEIRKSSVRIQERKEREQREFVEEIDLSSSRQVAVWRWNNLSPLLQVSLI